MKNKNSGWSMNRRDVLKAMAAVPASSLVALSGIESEQLPPVPATPMPPNVLVERDVFVPMRDGTRLAADIYRPSQNGTPVNTKLPVILVRTTYNKEAGGNLAKFFAPHEYAVVLQDVRGRYKSEGTFYHGVHEADDGYDTIEWIARQPWCNGKIGMTGQSYLAAVQQAACCANPPHLSAIFHVYAPANYYQNGFRHAGTFLMYTVSIALMMLGSTKEYWTNPALRKAADRARAQHLDWISAMPLKKGLTPLSLADSENEQWMFDMATRCDYDDFWKNNKMWQPVEYEEEYKDVPSYYVGGWYDLYREELFYEWLAKRKKGPIKLLMGPWVHGGIGRAETHVGDVDFGSAALVKPEEYSTLQLKWFDQALKGKTTGIYEEPPVKMFVMGGGDGRKNQEGRMNHGGKWRFEKDWPLPRARNTKFYFHADGSLSTTRPRDEKTTVFLYDPKDPVPTIGGASYFLGAGPITEVNNLQHAPLVPWGAFDQREDPRFFRCRSNLPLSARHDVLVYMTSSLTEDTEVTGPISVRLWASSSAVDTDFTAKLIDLYPPNEDYPEGYAMNLSDSIIRARYRNGFEKAELMKPGNVYEFTIDMPPTANLFAKGHRIVVHLSSSNYPAYDPNANTGEPYYTGRQTVVATNTIFHGGARASYIALPIVQIS